ncbi:MAG: histidine kinase [Christensenella sp.]
MEVTNGWLEVFAAIVILLLFINTGHSKEKSHIEKSFSVLLICHMLVLLLDAAHWFLYGRTDLFILMPILSFAPTILALIGNAVFIYFLSEFLSQKGLASRKAGILLLVFLVMAIITWASFILLNGIQNATSLQTNYNELQYSWSYWLGHLLWGAACVIGIGFVFRCRRVLSKNEMLSLISYGVFLLIALLLRCFWDGPQIFLATSLSLIWIYAVTHKAQAQRLSEEEARLAQSRIAILLSQIQPHFLYNTLNSICGLCDENPKEAKKITAEFADYLRHNLDSLSQRAPIPFSEELRHIKIYFDIEKKRFEDKLNIVYDIKTYDFLLPSLSVQPLVENAVKHGIKKRKAGGVITLSAREKDTCFEISIEDNGVGFDINAQNTNEKSHLGIQNVKDRLRAMCNGRLTIKSEVGVGTTVLISIPKGEPKQ